MLSSKIIQSFLGITKPNSSERRLPSHLFIKKRQTNSSPIVLNFNLLNGGSSTIYRLYVTSKSKKPNSSSKSKAASLLPKRSIQPGRLLDPALERKFEHSSRSDLVYDEKELNDTLFQVLDVDMEARSFDLDAVSDEKLAELMEQSNLMELEGTEIESTKKKSSSRKKDNGKNAEKEPKLSSRPMIYKKVPDDNLEPAPASVTLQAQPEPDAPADQNASGKPSLSRKPLIAIVGRPNVGKSTLFNRLIRKSKSLITTTAGTTRDRKYGFTVWEDYPLMLVDTGGMLGDGDPWSESITEQATLAIAEADIIVMIADVVDGITENDKLLARMLRKTSKSVILAVNKCDNEARHSHPTLNSFVQLGLGEPIAISASHGLGTAELLDAIIKPVSQMGFASESQTEDKYVSVSKDGLVTSGAFNSDGTRKEIRVALVGVPNVGKSSLLNQILGSKRSIVSNVPGTTTDPIDEKILWKGQYPLTLIDTAGVRKKKSQEGHVEKLSALWSLKVIESSHVSILLLDATTGPQAQDVKLSSYIIDNYRSCIVVVNKWDLSNDRSPLAMQRYEEMLRERLQFWYFVPIVFSSAKTGFNIDSILAWAVRVSDERRIHLATRRLFQVIEQASLLKQPPSKGNKRLKFRFCTQVNLGGSPTFIFFVNHPELADGQYTRFLEGFIRQNYAFTGTPIRLMFRKNEGRKFGEAKRKPKEIADAVE